MNIHMKHRLNIHNKQKLGEKQIAYRVKMKIHTLVPGAGVRIWRSKILAVTLLLLNISGCSQFFLIYFPLRGTMWYQ